MEPRRPFADDRYEFLRLLATGGMGQVWCARDTLLHRDVAVKVLRSEFTGNPTFLARFRAEAQHTAALLHPHIAAVYDYGELVPGPDGRGEHVAYLVMEFVDGEPLSAVLAREGRLAPERTLRLLRQVASALAAAHDAGVVHRDVKPANVLVTRDGDVKITDFGIASSTASVPLTQTGQVIGTAHYLSPEQAQGARATPASDVYALGAVAYECLAGRRAFDGESSVQVALMQIRDEPPPLPSDVPGPLRRLIERALVKDPAYRFADGAAFRDAVDAVLAGRDLEPALVLPATAAASGSSPAATVVLGPPPAVAPTGAPAFGAVPAADTEPAAERPALVPPSRGDRSRRPAWLLAGVLAVAAVIAGAVSVGHSMGDGTPTALERSGAPSASATASQTAVDVNAADYIGRPVAEVQSELTSLGLQVTVRQITTADLPAGQVVSVDPSGRLTPGDTVTVTAAVAPVVSSPAPAPTGGVQGTGTQGGTGTSGGGGSKGGGHGKGHGKDK